MPVNKIVPKIAIVGTGTDVGKTVFSFLMLKKLYSQKGCNPLYIKPFQTGCEHPNDPHTDAGFIYDNIPQLAGLDPAYSIIHCHKHPKAPYFAARDMDQQIDIPFTIATIAEKEKAGFNNKAITHLVIEAAGGLLVPITPDTMVVDFIALTKAVPVVVSHAGLGTINHTLLSLQCLERVGITPACVVLMDCGADPTDSDMILENIETIEAFSSTPVAGVIHHLSDFTSSNKATDTVIQEVINLI
jgi:dethiobiotin synthetase